MAVNIEALGSVTATARHARRLHYRGLEVRPADLAVADPPRAGRAMFWRGVVFDGALLDVVAVTPRRPQFYRGVFF